VRDCEALSERLLEGWLARIGERATVNLWGFFPSLVRPQQPLRMQGFAIYGKSTCRSDVLQRLAAAVVAAGTRLRRVSSYDSLTAAAANLQAAGAMQPLEDGSRSTAVHSGEPWAT
jgi:hypothetical protein